MRIYFLFMPWAAPRKVRRATTLPQASWFLARTRLTGLLAACLLTGSSLGAQTNVLETIRASRKAFQGWQGATVSGAAGQAVTDPRAAAIAGRLRQFLPLASAGQADAGQAPAPSREGDQEKALQLLRQSAGTDTTVHWRLENRTVRQIQGRRLESPPVGPALTVAGDREERTARSFLRRQRSLLRLADPDNELKLVERVRDEIGHQHFRFVQVYQGLPVWPAGLSVHLDPAGAVRLLDGAYIPTPAGISIQPAIDATRAAELARNSLGEGKPTATSAAELVVYAPLDQPPRLGWKLEVSSGLAHVWRVVVDAQDGRLLHREDRCPDGSLVGSGKDLDGATRPLNLWQQGGTNYLIDTSKPMFQAGFDPVKDPHGVIQVVDARGVTQDQVDRAGVFMVTSADANNWAVPEAVNAATNVSATYDYYLERHNRNSINGQGGTLTALVRVGQLDNAFWNDQVKVMVFGNVKPYVKALDVIGHEMTHGVTFATAGLVYHNQPGAMNESFSDIFGEMVEARSAGQTDWLLGTGLGTVVRDMKDPGSLSIGGLNRPYPAKMSEYIQLPDDDSHDHGGVHINSSVFNHAYYLFAAGLTNAVGVRDAERVFYRALTQHLQPQSQFIDGRLACLASAQELFGQNSPQARAAAAAFDAVEIFDAPSAPPPSPLPVVQAPDSALFVYFDWTVLNYALGRRETAQGDGNGGATLAGPTQYSRPSVSGDGALAVFVDAQYDLGAVLTANPASEQRLGYPGQVYSVAVSPDKRYYAFVLRDPLTGLANNQINLFDLGSNTVRTFKLLAPVIDSAPVDEVLNAGSMVFSSDSQTLIYDAVSQLRFADVGTVQRWSIFGLDLRTGTVFVIVPPLEKFDTGNPSIGRAGIRYLTFEALDRTSTNSTIINLDLFTGDTSAVGTVKQGIGFPFFTGDESAVIYAKDDRNSLVGFSLVKQPLGADRLTPVGQPTPWLQNALIGVVYRRGTFVPSNALPQVTLTGPTNGAAFTPPATIALAANASQSDGQIAKVEFYQGSTKLGEATAPPYSLTWTNVPAGNYRLIARAINSLGGATDSTAVTITVAPAGGTLPIILTQPANQTVVAGGNATFSVSASGTAPLTYQWQFQDANLAGQNAPTLTLTQVQTNQAGPYRLIVSNASGSATSAEAQLTVTPTTAVNPTNATLRITSWRLASATEFDLTFSSQPSQTYQLEASTNLQAWTALATALASTTNTAFRDTNVGLASRRFYRIRLGAAAVTTTNTLATMPQAGLVYPAGTQMGGSLFGLQFSIPVGWSGGLQPRTPLLVFTSGTYTNIVVASVVGFAGDQNYYLQDPSLQGGFQTTIGNDKAFMAPVKAISAVAPNRLTAEYQGAGSLATYDIALDITIHPSGGGILFYGLCTVDKKDAMNTQLKAFGDTVQTTPRPTDTAMMQQLNGRSYHWAGGGNDWYSNQSGYYSKDAAVSDWTDNYTFFCAQGTFDVNKTTTTYASTTSASNVFSQLSGSSTSTESGQWTIVKDPQYGDLIFMVTQSGYLLLPIKFDLDGSLLVGPNRLAPYGTFDCH